MKRKEIIKEIKNYFSIKELVSREVFNKFGHKSWMFFDTDLLHTILIIRKELDKPITINNWDYGGSFTQRGLRENTGYYAYNKTVNKKMYLSAHTMGKALDFDVKDMEAEEVRKWILNNRNILPCKIRLEHKYESTQKPITWVHLDTYYLEENPKVHLFNV